MTSPAVTTCCYCITCVGTQLSGLCQYDKWADRKWQQTVVRHSTNPAAMQIMLYNLPF